MIQKFRWRFIALSVLSLFLVLLIPIGSLVAISSGEDWHTCINRILGIDRSVLITWCILISISN